MVAGGYFTQKGIDKTGQDCFMRMHQIMSSGCSHAAKAARTCTACGHLIVATACHGDEQAHSRSCHVMPLSRRLPRSGWPAACIHPHLASGSITPLLGHLLLEDGIFSVSIDVADAGLQLLPAGPAIGVDLVEDAHGAVGAIVASRHGALLPKAGDILPPHPRPPALIAQLVHAQLPQIFLRMSSLHARSRPRLLG